MLATASGVLIYRETRRPERDWHAVRAQVLDIEKALRRHDTYVYVRRIPVDGTAQLPEATEQRLIADLERLSHLRGFAMTDVEVRIDGETAFVRYRVLGTPPLRNERPPIAGELVFRRFAQGWLLMDGRLIE